MAVDEAELSRAASGVVAWCVAHDFFLDERDARWGYNRVLECVGAYGPTYPGLPGEIAVGEVDGLLDTLSEVAVENGVVEDTATGRDRVRTRVMGALMPRPSDVAENFYGLESVDGSEAATDWFYQLCCDADYVKRAAIARNLAWTSPTPWGDLEITVNKSKPEKDPRDIAASGRASVGEAYPACQLCVENEGYSGRPASSPNGPHPARQNLRIVPITLGGEPWGLQYSPYAYFGEHCIVMSEVHRPMHVDRENVARLLEFVERFPHYFVGSNADLPIVGGSILSHDHFQGGRHRFPMMRAEVVERFSLTGYPHVEAGVVRWPLSVIRLRSKDTHELVDAAAHALDAWRGWSDPSVGVFAETDGVRHNTVTPICHHDGDAFVLDLTLRCNVTTPEHPLGVFHPHEGLWHIKKENIGLIEVMGMAILPPRLEPELGAVIDHLLAGDEAALDADPLTTAHAAWAREVAAAHPELCGENAHEIIRGEVGQVFGRVLEDAGVFKWNEGGRAAQRRFVESL